jgi:hypothetical protein
VLWAIVLRHQNLFTLFSLPMPDEITNFALAHKPGAGHYSDPPRVDVVCGTQTTFTRPSSMPFSTVMFEPGRSDGLGENLTGRAGMII